MVLVLFFKIVSPNQLHTICSANKIDSLKLYNIPAHSNKSYSIYFCTCLQQQRQI